MTRVHRWLWLPDWLFNFIFGFIPQMWAQIKREGVVKVERDCYAVGKLMARLKTSSAECNERLEASDALIAEVERELVGMQCPMTVRVPAGRGYVEWAAGYSYPWEGLGGHGSLRYGPNAMFGSETLKYASVESRILAAAQLKRLLSEAQLKAKAFAVAAEGV